MKYDQPCPIVHVDCNFHPLSVYTEPDKVLEHNGFQVLLAPTNTYNRVVAFKKWLKESIDRTKKNKEIRGGWVSSTITGSCETEYICLKKTNFCAKKDGKPQWENVISRIENEQKVKIDVKFAVDKLPADKHQLRIRQISWRLTDVKKITLKR